MATTAELVHREYWTPDEAARVLGRSSGFWRNAFDTQLVTGYRDGERGNRNIAAASARAYLHALCAPVVAVDVQAQAKEALRAMRERNRARSAQAGSGR